MRKAEYVDMSDWKQAIKPFADSFDFSLDPEAVKTESLKARIAEARETHPGIPYRLFDEIMLWKLRGQHGRQRHIRHQITPALWEHLTAAALNLSHPDPDLQARMQVEVLAAMPGIGIPTATAILALALPEQHGIIDIRVWRVMFGRRQNESFTTSDYMRYLRELRPFAGEIGLGLQQADLLVWSFYEEMPSEVSGVRRGHAPSRELEPEDGSARL